MSPINRNSCTYFPPFVNRSGLTTILLNTFFDVHENVLLRSEIIRFIFSISFYEVYVVKI